MKKITTLFLIFSFVAGFAQSNEEFKPSGKPFSKIFFNYHTDLEEVSAFEIQRAYFGYKYNLSKEFSADITLDVGAPDIEVEDTSGLILEGGSSLQMTAYLKTAGITYKKGNLKVQLGLIGLQQFKVSEKYWGHRYIYKAFQDAYKMGTSADLGVLATYKFADAFSADLTIRNGEGYKKLDVDENFLYGLGLTLTPVKGLIIRGYYDYLKGDDTQITLSHFVGYKNEGLTLGAEYNIQKGNKTKTDHDLSGFSVAASYDINERYQVFGRYDYLSSNIIDPDPDPWNISKDGSFIIAGVQYSPIKKIQLALNYQGKMPAEAGEDMGHAAYLSCQFAF